MEQIKIVVVGDDGSGKSTFLQAATSRSFRKKSVPLLTDAAPFSMVVDEKEYEVQLYDTENTDYPRLRCLFYPEASVVLICFSLDRETYLERIRTHWVREIKQYRQDIQFCLVGTKLDLRDPDIFSEYEIKSCISYKKGLEMAKQIGAKRYIECSSFTFKGIDSVIHEAIKVTITPNTPEIPNRNCQTM